MLAMEIIKNYQRGVGNEIKFEFALNDALHSKNYADKFLRKIRNVFLLNNANAARLNKHKSML